MTMGGFEEQPRRGGSLSTQKPNSGAGLNGHVA